MKVLILGGTGMLGHQMIKWCLANNIDWYTIVREKDKFLNLFGLEFSDRTFSVSDIKNILKVESIIAEIKPTYLINCIGVVKQSSLAKNNLESIAINSLLPHQLEDLCRRYNSFLIHISTDCIFDGVKGNYTEEDESNAVDLYGRSKYLGEVSHGFGLTIRTSIIGHEITKQTHGLLDWFLAQEGQVNGYSKAIFSGLTTYELTKVIFNVVIKQRLKAGLYQVAAPAISKYDLLKIVNTIYAKEININLSLDLVIDRSLSGAKFNSITGYVCPSWEQLIIETHADSKYNTSKI